MPFTTVKGKHTKHTIRLYTLSTCGWCRKTKDYLRDHDISYDYVDVDRLNGKEYKQISTEHARYNPRRSFPTIVIDDGKEVITGFNEDELKKALA
jgi:glutaredoxin-like protein NrdH